MLWLTLAFGFTFIFWVLFVKKSTYWKLVDKIPGPPGIPFLGNALSLAVDHSDVVKLLVAWYDEYGIHKLFKFRVGSEVYVYFIKASSLETILSSSEFIEKSWIYNMIMPWLKTGLITSTGQKWKVRRKLLTPAFHFRILEDFTQVFNEHSKIFIKQLTAKAENRVIDVFPLMTRFTLDVICETTMGCNINAQTTKDSDYVKALIKICDIVMTRMFSPWLQIEWLFKLLPISTEHDRCLKTLHDFTRKVIQDRRREWKELKSRTTENEEDALLGKRRLAFLDLLLETSQDGKVFSDDDIHEEVDTFMFAGHDTTAAAMSAVLYLLGRNHEHQLKVQQELDAVLGDDENRYITSEDVTNLKYLECVIKESLRLLPAVPLISRKLTKDVVVENFKVPAGVAVMISPYLVHRDAEVFPEPDKFDPGRFTQDAIAKRKPYAYIPFSAGPRNCIGQKFAMLEMKIALAHVLRKFSIKSTQNMSELKLSTDVILRPLNGYKLLITLRK